jgi:hypothetical protein
MKYRATLGPALAATALALVLSVGLTGIAPAQSAFESGFDHDSTAWPLEGSHRNVDCGTCHVAGIFEGTPRQCAACHARGSLVQATGVPLDHIRTTDECDACHRQTAWAYVRRVDHNAVNGSCLSCHNGLTATGKPPRHVPTSSDCEACHSTRAWSPAG